MLPGHSLRLFALILLAAAEPEVVCAFVILPRVSFIMAVPAGRSVVFVTGNAKKLEEVTARYLSPARGCVLTGVLPFVVRLRKNTTFLDAFRLVESVFAKFTQTAWPACNSELSCFI